MRRKEDFMYDVAIIGAGLSGCAVARELAKYKLDVCVLEKENDVATGASRANSAIVHAGYDCEPGSLMAKLNVAGAAAMEALCMELDVPFKRIGSLVLAFDDDDKKQLESLLERAKLNGVEGVEILDAGQTHDIQENISGEVVASLWAKTAAITSPYELNIALAENAVVNGVDIKLNFMVEKISKKDGVFELCSPMECVQAKYVVNAAGLYADQMSGLCGAGDFTIIPRKGEYMLMDKRESRGMNTPCFSRLRPRWAKECWWRPLWKTPFLRDLLHWIWTTKKTHPRRRKASTISRRCLCARCRPSTSEML